MAYRRSLRVQQQQQQQEEKEEPRTRRSSQRLKSKQGVPFSYQRSLAYQTSITSEFMHSATPRTVFRKVLQTQSIVSPIDSEKPDSPKSTETVIQLSAKASSSINLEISLPDSTQRETSRIGLHSTRPKKVRLSAFERELNKQFHSSTDHSLLNRTSLTKSLQISLSTPAPPNFAGKTGLVRWPKNYQGVNVKDFEGDLEQNLLQVKDSVQNYLEDRQAASLLPSDTGAHSAETELFIQPPPSREVGTGLPIVPSEPLLTRPSLANGSVLHSSWTPSGRQEEMSDMEVESVSERSQREISAQESQSADEAEAAPKEKASECQESLQDARKGVPAKRMLSPGPRDNRSMEAMSQKRMATPRRSQQGHFYDSSPLEEFLSPKEPLLTGGLEASPIASKNSENSALVLEAHPGQGPLRSSTPTDGGPAEAHQGHLSTWLNRRTTRRSVNEMVTHIIRELDDILLPAVTGQDVAKVVLEEEFSLSKSVTRVSQRASGGTSKIHLSGKTPKHLEKTPIKEMTDGRTSQTHDGGTRKEMSGVETEQVLMVEAENIPEVEEMSESNTDSENAEPTGNTPAFVHAKAFHCTPLMSSPCVPRKVSSGSAPIKQTLVERVPRQAKKARREKHGPALPSSLVKNIFSHYVKMPLARDALKAVERCVSLYFKHLSNDLEAYTRHAGRKKAEPADLELLMRRQGLITDKMPLNVLVERHLPLEYRKLLIPVATSGNKVIPNKL